MRTVIRTLLAICLLMPRCTTPGDGGRLDGEFDGKAPEGEPGKKWSGVAVQEYAPAAFERAPGAATSENAGDWAASGAARAAGGPLAGFERERVVSVFDDWEPALAADPSDPRFIYQCVTRFNGPVSKIWFRRSSDGGATWDLERIPVDRGRWQADPQIEAANDGTVYAMWLEKWKTLLSTSKDHGESWSKPVSISGDKPRFTDHGWLVISPSGRDVYVGFNANNSFVSASHDFGQTFAPPVKTSSDARFWFHTGGAVASDGTVYIATTDFGRQYEGKVNIGLLRSIDGGASWDYQRIDRSAEPPDCPWAAGCYPGFLGPGTGVAVDAAGMVMFVYNAGDARGAAEPLWVRTSTDGVNFGERVQLSPDLPEANNAFPAVAAGPLPGDFRVVWQGDNGDPRTWNTWHRSTKDGGRTWTDPIRLSDAGAVARYKSEEGYRFPYGDYFEMAVDPAGVTHVIWGEGKSYNGPGGVWYTRGSD